MATYGQLPVAYRAVLLAAGLLVFGLLFQQLITLLVAVLVTVIISIPLAAIADRLEARKVPRPVGAAAGLVASLAILAGIIALVVPPFIDQAEEFVDEVPATVEDLEKTVGQLIGANPTEVGNSVQDFLEGYVDDPERLIGPLTSIGLSVVGILGALIFMLITAYFIAVRPAPLINGMLALFPRHRRDAVRHLTARLRDAWIGWLQGVVVDMLVTGVLLYAGLSLIGLDFAIFFAVFSALLVVIPYFGAILGAVPVVLFALADGPGTALAALAVYIVVQQVESNMIIPLVMAQRVKLHPALIAIGVILVGQLFGFVGLFVAVPIISAFVILVDEVWVKPLEAQADLEAAAEPDADVPKILSTGGA
jgi:predicted PurR-regulated permease PerM